MRLGHLQLVKAHVMAFAEVTQGLFACHVYAHQYPRVSYTTFSMLMPGAPAPWVQVRVTIRVIVRVKVRVGVGLGAPWAWLYGWAPTWLICQLPLSTAIHHYSNLVVNRYLSDTHRKTLRVTCQGHAVRATVWVRVIPSVRSCC